MQKIARLYNSAAASVGRTLLCGGTLRTTQWAPMPIRPGEAAVLAKPKKMVSPRAPVPRRDVRRDGVVSHIRLGSITWTGIVSLSRKAGLSGEGVGWGVSIFGGAPLGTAALECGDDGWLREALDRLDAFAVAVDLEGWHRFDRLA